MTLVTQADFAARKSVSRAAVTKWKKEGRLTMIGNAIELEATEAAMLRNSSFRSKRSVPARQEGVNASIEVNAPAPLASYPATLAAMVTGGAADLAVILLRTMPRATVQGLVDEWLADARRGATETLGDDLAPPDGFACWADHPAFQEDLTAADWAELEAEASAGRAA